jgi:hypothetical protein
MSEAARKVEVYGLDCLAGLSQAVERAQKEICSIRIHVQEGL